jgi:hypothetical protein
MNQNVSLTTAEMATVTHEVKFEVLTTFGMAESRSNEYVEVMLTAFQEYLDCSVETKIKPAFEEAEALKIYWDKRRRMQRLSNTIIIFSAMAIESAIFDLAAVQLGQSFAEDVLDKLDVVGKWLVTPRLVCGKGLDPKGPGLNALRHLVKAQNALVHSKSISIGGIADTGKSKTKLRVDFELDVTAAFQAMALLSLDLTALLKTPSLFFMDLEIYGKMAANGTLSYQFKLSRQQMG